MEHLPKRSLIENACLVLPITLVHSAIYRFLTRHHLSTPRILEPTWVDRQIPFNVWMVWPYLAMVIVCIVAPMLVRDRSVFRRLVVSYLCAVTILLFIYVILPTAIQRESRESDPASLTWFVYRQFAEGLGSACAFPSGHIVFPMLGCWALFRDQFPAARTIALVTALSSVSIPQHQGARGLGLDRRRRRRSGRDRDQRILVPEVCERVLGVFTST